QYYSDNEHLMRVDAKRFFVEERALAHEHNVINPPKFLRNFLLCIQSLAQYRHIVARFKFFISSDAPRHVFEVVQDYDLEFVSARIAHKVAVTSISINLPSEE